MNLQIIKISDLLWLKVLQKLPHDIYHLPQYVYLESLRIDAIPEAILITEGDKMFFVPYLVRCCNDIFKQLKARTFDIVSPYGYPGLLFNEAANIAPDFIKSAFEQFMHTLRNRNVCSAFLRLHPILNEGLNSVLSPKICKITGQTVSIDLKQSKAEIWHQTSPGHRNKINRCERRGFTAKVVSFQDYLADFVAIYEETMDRVKANKKYYFSDFYFSYLSTKLAKQIHLAIVELDKQIACAGLFTECDGIVQYHLGGTKSEYLKEAPSKLMFDYIRYWAKDRGNFTLHLGGGLGGSKEDGLYRFKAAFSQQRHTFMTLRLITQEEQYLALTQLKAKQLNMQASQLFQSNFFPAYRFS